jgi:hypothetical protein
MGTGTDVAIESAGMTLAQAASPDWYARRLAQATMRNIRQNLAFSFLFNGIGIPLAAGMLYPVFGLTLSPMFAGGAMAVIPGRRDKRTAAQCPETSVKADCLFRSEGNAYPGPACGGRPGRHPVTAAPSYALLIRQQEKSSGFHVTIIGASASIAVAATGRSSGSSNVYGRNCCS